MEGHDSPLCSFDICCVRRISPHISIDRYCAHSTSTMSGSDSDSDLLVHEFMHMMCPGEDYHDVKLLEKRWSFQEEISKLFAESLERSFPEFKQDPVIYGSQEGEDGDYNCQNVLWIWPKLRKSPELQQKYSDIKKPTDVGMAIKKNLPKSAMIDGEASIQDVGFVAISLSQKWFITSIHKMLRYGINTWAPELPVKRVLVVDFPPLGVNVGWFQQRAIGDTLVRMLKFSGADVALNINPVISRTIIEEEPENGMIWAERLLKKSFLIKGREGVMVINGKGKAPFSLAKRDFDNSYKHLRTLRYALKELQADWIVYVTPIERQDCIEMCFTAAKLEEWYPSMNGYPKTSYVGYRTFSEPKEFVSLFEELKSGCVAVAEGEDAQSLGYTPEAVLDCVLQYTFLKNYRMAACIFNVSEMLSEKEDSFLYLLKIRAQIHRITTNFWEDIYVLKTAPKVILENNKGRGVEGKERALEFHILEFTEVLKDSCLYGSPHILCAYLHGLAKKFTRYDSSVRKFGSVAKTGTLLVLCQATAVVMETCFHLLGITPEFSNSVQSLQSFAEKEIDVNSRAAIENQKGSKRKQKGAKRKQEKKPFKDFFVTYSASSYRDPPRNSRFELFAIRSTIKTDSKFRKGKLFGLVSVTDRSGLLPDAGSHVSEPDFTYIPLLNVNWSDPINTRNGGVVCLGDPSSGCPIPFSSTIGIHIELNVTTEKNDACFHLCNTKFEIDTNEFWAKKLDSKCGRLSVNSEDGVTHMYYILLKDAVDTVLEVTLKTKTPRKVTGTILAYYGDGCDFPFESYNPIRSCYDALLFRSDLPVDLNDGKIKLKRSVLSVPMRGSLTIEADLTADAGFEQVILKGSHAFKPQRRSSSNYTIYGGKGTNCALDLKVNWDYHQVN